METIFNRSCKPCEGGVKPFNNNEITERLTDLPQWEVLENPKRLIKLFTFKDYYQTVAFVNAVAWLSHIEDHHPNLLVTFNTCKVEYYTHAIRGLSENDFICARKVDALISNHW